MGSIDELVCDREHSNDYNPDIIVDSKKFSADTAWDPLEKENSVCWRVSDFSFQGISPVGIDRYICSR